MNAQLHETMLRIQKRLTVLLIAAAAMLLTGAAMTANADALYILTGVEDSAIVLDGSVNAPALPAQLTQITGRDVSLARGLPVTIQRDDQIITTESKRKEAVSALLKRMEITPAPLETVVVDVSDSGVEIRIDEEVTYYERITEEIPYQTVRVPTADLPKGQERVVQEGANGIRTAIYEVVRSNGKELSRQFVENLGSSVVDEVIEYGTFSDEVGRTDPIVNITKNEDGSGTLEFASGSILKFSETKAMTATAYTAGYGGADYTTATGTFVKIGVAAVDKKVIPLGTRMFVVTNDGVVYGLARAEDTGVRGNVIDLYHNTYEDCINFGRRPCTVYILEE